MESILTAIAVTAVKLVELIFLAKKAPRLSQDEIDDELKSIQNREEKLISSWWKLVKRTG